MKTSNRMKLRERAAHGARRNPSFHRAQMGAFDPSQLFDSFHQLVECGALNFYATAGHALAQGLAPGHFRRQLRQCEDRKSFSEIRGKESCWRPCVQNEKGAEFVPLSFLRLGDLVQSFFCAVSVAYTKDRSVRGVSARRACTAGVCGVPLVPDSAPVGPPPDGVFFTVGLAPGQLGHLVGDADAPVGHVLKTFEIIHLLVTCSACPAGTRRLDFLPL